MTESGQLGPSDDASVLIDIGGDVGALIIQTGPELHLAEIEISRVDGAAPVPGGSHDHAQPRAPGDSHVHDRTRTHVAVRERRGPRGSRWAAIYPALVEGDYIVWGLDGAEADRVRIVGGEVSELRWQ